MSRVLALSAHNTLFADAERRPSRVLWNALDCDPRQGSHHCSVIITTLVRACRRRRRSVERRERTS
jgi:hypothetical protein